MLKISCDSIPAAVCVVSWWSYAVARFRLGVRGKQGHPRPVMARCAFFGGETLVNSASRAIALPRLIEALLHSLDRRALFGG